MSITRRKPTGKPPWTHVLLAGSHKSGKAQPFHSRLVTPTGWTTMGEVEVGTKLVGADGQTVSVTAVHERGPRNIYRVTFSDGASVDACDEHLWASWTMSQRHSRTKITKVRRNPPATIRTTAEIKRLVDAGRSILIPMAAPVQYAPGDPLPLDAYALGLLVGDGCLVNRWPCFTPGGDQELIDALGRSLPSGDVLLPHSGTSTNLSAGLGSGSRAVRALESLGLIGKKSLDKFIPQTYLHAPIADRIALLQGLMDTDGGVEAHHVASFATSSPALARDFQELVESLGGRAKMRVRPGVYVKDGVRHVCADSHVLVVRLPGDIAPFRLTRKLNAWLEGAPRRLRTEPTRVVREVAYLGMMPARCITVDAKDHLYLTDHFVVTHNSIELALASSIEFVGQTFWITFGERSADEYSAVPGSRFEIIECDNRHDLKTVVKDLVREKRVNPDQPNLIAFDSITALWELLAAEAQDTANARAARKAKGPGFDPVKDADIHTDLWNEAKTHWYEILNPLLGSPELVVLTARLDEVTIMENGQPTKFKEFKAAAHKRIAGDVDAVIHYRGEWPDQKRLLVGARSFELSKNPGLDPRRPKDYGIAALLAEMNINPKTVDSSAGPQTPRPEGRMPSDWEELLEGYVRAAEVQKIRDLWGVANRAVDEEAKATIVAAGQAVEKRQSEEKLAAAKDRSAADKAGARAKPVADVELPTEDTAPEEAEEPPTDEEADVMDAAVAAASTLTEPVEDKPGPPSDATVAERVAWAKGFAWSEAAVKARRTCQGLLNDAREAGDVPKLDAVIRQATRNHWDDILRDAQGVRTMAQAR